ncbi:MAG: rhomboid family intramembrane serine protease [Myxococcales bacterium]|nr:rhomboid family intramembrane serine protease [Myxococcales bacterium]
MFFVYPIGHDQETYSRPWFTWGVIAVCALVFTWMQVAAQASTERVVYASMALDQARKEHPGAGLAQAQVDAAPPAVRPWLQELVNEEGAVSEDLDVAAADLIAAVQSLPILRVGYVPVEKRWSRAITSMFAHAGWMHIVGNLFLFFLVGAILEGFWQPAAYVALYFGAGIAGVVAHHLTDPASTVALVGASGAIAGCMAALLIGFARTRITLGWFLWIAIYVRAGRLQVPVWVLAPLWGGLQLLAWVQGDKDGVAYGAHVGGFVFGLAFALGADRLGWIARDGGHL